MNFIKYFWTFSKYYLVIMTIILGLGIERYISKDTVNSNIMFIVAGVFSVIHIGMIIKGYLKN
jgi:hypothetical protein